MTMAPLTYEGDQKNEPKNKKLHHHRFSRRTSRTNLYVDVTSPTNTGGDPMKVINVDKNGNIIEDLSKVKIPKELQIKVIKIMRGGQNGNKSN